MRTFAQFGFAFLALVSAATAGTKSLTFNTIELPTAVVVPFDDVTISTSIGTMAKSMQSVPGYGIGMYADTFEGSAFHPKDVITFDFAPLPVQSVHVGLNVSATGAIWVRVRTTEGLEASSSYQGADQPVECQAPNGASIVSVSIESATSQFFVRKLEYQLDTFVPGDRLRFDILGEQGIEPTCAYFFGVAGMTLELDQVAGSPEANGVVSIRRLDGFVDAFTMLGDKSKRSLKLNSSGWFEWSYRPLAGISGEEIEIQTRASFAKRDAKVTLPVMINSVGTGAATIDVPAFEGMTLSFSVAGGALAPDLLFGWSGPGVDVMGLDPWSINKKGELKLPAVVAMKSGRHILSVAGLQSQSAVNVTITRSAPVVPQVGPLVMLGGLGN